MIEITSPVGRLVSGHPMVARPVIDEKTKQPKMQRDGVTPQIDHYVGLAIPKGQETDWKLTEWGQQMNAEALASFPNGEHQMPAFSWKVTDGDSQAPNKNMKKPCDREGYPGHWVINMSNGFPIKCYHREKYDPTQQIQQKEAIKAGDYCRLVFTVKGNGAAPPNTPGIYVNPSMFELYQAGIEIISESAADPSATFGAVAGQMPANAQVDPNMAAAANTPATPATPATPGGGPAAPAMDVLTPVEVKYMLPDGTGPWTAEQLAPAGYTPELIAGLVKAP